MATPGSSREGHTTISWPTSATTFNLPAGSEVLIKLKDGQAYRGTVLKNPAISYKIKSMIEIVKVTNANTGEPWKSALMFTANEMTELTIINKEEPTADSRRERSMPTMLITSPERLEMLLNAISNTNVKEIGVSFINEGRPPLSTVSWVMLSCHDVITPIDAQKFKANEWPLWDKLRDAVFENKRIVKVFHNLRPAVDYLYHTHGIRIENVYDTQLVDFVLSKKETQASQGGSGPRKHMIPLHGAITKYLSHMASEKEVQLLKMHRQQTTDAPQDPATLATRRKLMALAVKYLIPLRDEIEKVKNSSFSRLFETYSQDVIDAHFEDPNVWCKDDQPMENLNATIRSIFAATQGGER